MNIAGAPAHHSAVATDRQVLFERIQMHVIHALVVKMIAIDSAESGAVFMPCGFSVMQGVHPLSFL
jgi:hypothetical protein